MSIHQDLADGRWFTLTLSEQLGNIGSEISRSINWQARQSKEGMTHALDRALELFDLTLADIRWRGRYKEIRRAREVVCDFFYGDNAFHSTATSLQNYFDAFALAARKNKDDT